MKEIDFIDKSVEILSTMTTREIREQEIIGLKKIINSYGADEAAQRIASWHDFDVAVSVCKAREEDLNRIEKALHKKGKKLFGTAISAFYELQAIRSELGGGE